MRYLLAGALGLFVAACAVGSSAPASVAPSATHGLTRDQAIAAARRAEPFDQVISISNGPIGQFDPRQGVVPGDRLVWAVVVSGRFPRMCGPSPGPGIISPEPCPTPAPQETIYVDFETGEFIEGSY